MEIKFRSIFWKIYAWLYSLSAIIGIVSIYTGQVPIKLYENKFIEITGSVVSLFSIVPLFLYAYKKSFLKQVFWKIFFFILIVFELKDIPVFVIKNPQFLLNGLFGIILSLPCYIAIFLYAFKRED